MNRVFVVLIALCLLVLHSPVEAQIRGARYLRIPASGVVQVVRLADGSTLVGRFTDVTGDPVRFELASGPVSIPRAEIREITESAARTVRSGEYWPDDPNPSRLFFGPTARTLPAGGADFSSTYLFLLSGSVSVGGVAQIGGGLSVLPLDDFSDNIFFATAKVGIPVNEKVQFAVGGIAGWAGGLDDEVGGQGIGAAYGVGTFGSKDHALTAGLALPFGDVDTKPVLLVGGETRISKRLKLVTENYFVTEQRTRFDGTSLTNYTAVVGVFGYGVRIFSEKLAVNLAFLNSTDGALFPGVPYVDVVIRF